jgi:hypothetical protein
MPRIKITNLKEGACVVNSLKITIPGKSSVTRDASIIGDPDLVELETEGIISVMQVGDSLPVIDRHVPPPLQSDKPQQGKKRGKKRKLTAKDIIQPTKTQKPGTSFRMNDGPGDEMGRTAVVMGEHGPEKKKMNPGINSHDTPRFIGDPESPADTDEDNGFTKI